MLILFGGGDGGGFNFINGQFHPIPPLGPELVEHLRTLSQVVRLSEVESKAEVVAGAQLAARNLVGLLAQFDRAKGVITTDGRVADFAFADVDGGMICGTNGNNLHSFPRLRPPAGGPPVLR